MDIKDYDKRLRNHDWYFTWSDDYSVYSRGDRDRKELIRITEESPAHAELFNAYNMHYFSGDQFGKPDFNKQALDALRQRLDAIS